MASVVADLTWLLGMLKEIGLKFELLVTIYSDNKAAIQTATNPVFHERIKHIEIDCHFIREKIQQGLVRTEYINTNEQPTDILTKGLNKVQHLHLRSKLGLLNIFTPPSLRGSIEYNDKNGKENNFPPFLKKMEKTSKTVPQKETPSTSRPTTETDETVSRAAVDEPVPEPPLKMFIPGGCSVNINFNVEKPSSVQGRCDEPLLGSQTLSLDSRSGLRVSYHRCPIPSTHGASSQRAVGRLGPTGATKLEIREADLPQAREVDEGTRAEASRDAGSSSKEAFSVIDITESPSFIESMYNEAQMVIECPN
uniref:Uncharacterized protein n=1 Tax=Nicotiana tabacum TaxID=4097 RepID=A0A1S3XGM8_TOBAC|nr:PREDICTED: uncharacterized protein LOC107765039 [Nicotiana tabacum]